MIKSYFSRFIGLDVLMPFMIILFLVFIGVRLMASKTPNFKKQQKKCYYYLLIHLVVMAVVAAIVYNLRQSTVMLRYVTWLVCAFIMGVLHVYLYRIVFAKFDTDHTFKEFLFAFITSTVLVIPVIMLSSYFDDLEFLPYYVVMTAAFVIPTCFYILFNYSISIPVKLYSKWYYPFGKKYDNPKHYELNNMIVLNFMFHKNTREEHMTRFKAKAPKEMDFGRLFYFFINDYNEKKAPSKIELTEDSGNPHGWYFYTKPKWYGSSIYIDSEVSVEKNKLEDGDVVVCQRI